MSGARILDIANKLDKYDNRTKLTTWEKKIIYNSSPRTAYGTAMFLMEYEPGEHNIQGYEAGWTCDMCSFDSAEHNGSILARFRWVCLRMHVDLCRDCGHRQILSRHKSKQSGTLHQHDPIAQQAVYNQFPYEVRVQQTQRASFGNSTTWRNGPHSVALPTHYPQNQYNPDTLHQATTLNRASGAFGGRPMEQSMGVATEYTHAYHHQVPRVGGRVVTCEIEPRLPMGLSMRNSSDHVSLNHNNTASLTRSSKHAATAKKKIDPAKSAYDVYRFVKRREIVHENGEQGLDHAIDALIHESWEDIGADEQNLYEPRSIISKLVKSKVSAYMFYRAEQHRRLTKQHTFSKIAELVGRQVELSANGLITIKRLRKPGFMAGAWNRISIHFHSLR
eukprot:m.903273 g.903273  ORF g.903273 m.903273 type:complete len:391 (-) comp23694_c0_seq26:4245-5417(-)